MPVTVKVEVASNEGDALSVANKLNGRDRSAEASMREIG